MSPVVALTVRVEATHHVVGQAVAVWSLATVAARQRGASAVRSTECARPAPRSAAGYSATSSRRPFTCWTLAPLALRPIDTVSVPESA